MEYNWSEKNILIAEDVDVNYRFLEKILQDTGANILRVMDGKEAVDFCKKHDEVDLVLMDIQMPGMDGFEASKAIKSIRHDLPIIAQTAHAIEGGREKGLESGCDEYIVKPININKMYATIDKYFSPVA
ncbi:Polar-differentiation response regulator DivK [Salinivirga cyanobacteriivorans]|uniref:Polar-differentiation response regulator DivK n=1 Tax=Salinivirga cyanobacteriivorans TaxID=1307839 RepID=A0A0S2HZC9_9BACT|nr:response regulator [Salinivirga cyanobacteriivorans]ALO15475.1 Polar-differentiation response regulator DivK [Salinivirga cyanobacteriivorans]